MSSMLEQAIVDAAALREAALKNAEQAIIDKYAPEIKAAVDSLLESDNTINEQEGLGGLDMGGAPEATYDAPLAAGDLNPDASVDLEMTLEFDPEDFNVNLGDLEDSETIEAADAEEDLLGDLGDLGGDEPAEGPEEDELALQEILDILSETDNEEVIEEELAVDMAGEHKNGTFESNQGTLEYQQEMELAKKEADEYNEEKEVLEKKLEELDEALTKSQNQSKEFKSIIEKLEAVLNETLLSNAKLLYSNQTLSDASLNERQKNKIVEAIATAKTPDEAKTLQETLKATVGSTKKYEPKSLSESIQRRSNLSGILPRKKQPVQELSFAERMRKLAGIE